MVSIDAICPLSKKKIKEPVIAPDGHTYERKLLTKFIKKFKKSPITGEPIDIDTLVYSSESESKFLESDIKISKIRDEIDTIINLKCNVKYLEVLPQYIKISFKSNFKLKTKSNSSIKKKHKNTSITNKNESYKTISFSSHIYINDEFNFEEKEDIRKSFQYNLSYFYFSLFEDSEEVFKGIIQRDGTFKIYPLDKFLKKITNKSEIFINQWLTFTKEAKAKQWLDDITSDEIISAPIRVLLGLVPNKKVLKDDFKSPLSLEDLNDNQKKVFEIENFKQLQIMEGPPGTGKTTVISKLSKFIEINCGNFICDEGNIDIDKHITIIISEKNRGISAVAERLSYQNYDSTLAFGSDNVGLETSKYVIYNKIQANSEIIIMNEELTSLYQDIEIIIENIKVLLRFIFSIKLLNTFNFYTIRQIEFYIQNMRNSCKKKKVLHLFRKLKTLEFEYYELFEKKKKIQEKLFNYYLNNCKTILVTFGSLHNTIPLFNFSKKKTISIITDESSTLLPWQGFYLEKFINDVKCKFINLILIGDPKQLPPYWLDSDNCKKKKSLLDISKTQVNSCYLNIQYRLPKTIMNTLNKFYYKENPLILGNPEKNNGSKNSIAWMHVNGKDNEETNQKEILYILYCLRSIPSSLSIIILSPYKAQCELIQNVCVNNFPNIQVMTLDQSQGHEADIIAVSLVKSSPTSFLTDNRTCVMISRAKQQLILFGNRQNYLLCKNPALRTLARFPGNLKYNSE